MADAKKVDAIICPLSKESAALARLTDIQGRYGSILGGKVYHRHQGHYAFLTTDPAASLLFPDAHPLAKESRYTWVDQGNGVQYGTLRPEAAPDWKPGQ